MVLFSANVVRCVYDSSGLPIQTGNAETEGGPDVDADSAKGGAEPRGKGQRPDDP